MANDYFKFKQFTIHQDLCAMKVTTLGCIQGAWLPDISPNKILDIGAGTGLLSLMCAQKYACEIDAVEIENQSFTQLEYNTAMSKWRHRITCHHDNIKTFAKNNSKKYDFIISNPPFFENYLKSPNSKINVARHDSALTIQELIELFQILKSPTGQISILLPPAETEKMVQGLNNKSLFVSDQLFISDTPQKSPKAIVTILSSKPSIHRSKKLSIKMVGEAYSLEFTTLLKDYYLYL